MLYVYILRMEYQYEKIANGGKILHGPPPFIHLGSLLSPSLTYLAAIVSVRVTLLGPSNQVGLSQWPLPPP